MLDIAAWRRIESQIMDKTKIIRHFGGVAATAGALGISRNAVYKWGEEVPMLRQYQIEKLTNGEFRAEAVLARGKS